jgi:hypothetical protein
MEQIEQKVEREEYTCSHCLGTGWVVMGAESGFGEYEEYFVLCRGCKESE